MSDATPMLDDSPVAPDAGADKVETDGAPDALESSPEAGFDAEQDVGDDCNWEGSYGDPMTWPLRCDQVERAFSARTQWDAGQLRAAVLWCDCNAFCSWYGDVLEIDSTLEPGWATVLDSQSACGALSYTLEPLAPDALGKLRIQGVIQGLDTCREPTACGFDITYELTVPGDSPSFEPGTVVSALGWPVDL